MEKQLLLCVMFYYVFAIDLPPNFPKCKRSDPNLNKCLISAYDDSLPILAEGMPDFKLDTIQPIKAGNMTIGEGPGVVSVVQYYTNVEYYNLHLTSAQNCEATITDNEFRMIFTIFAKDISMHANYKLQGHVLVVPIFGEGACSITLKNSTIILDIVGEFFNKNNEKYVIIKTLNATFDPKKVELEFKNLFNGDTEMGAEMNYILNENWREIFHDVKQSYEVTISESYKRIINLIVKNVPYNDLFPL